MSSTSLTSHSRSPPDETHSASILECLFYTRLLVSPVGDALVLDFSKALIAGEQLGQDAIPDYLSISFSAVDAVNHFFGPSSLENEDLLLQLDRTLADLFAFVDQAVGLERTLIVLAADHGMPEMPEAMAERDFPAGRLYPEDVVARANEAARLRFGMDEAVRQSACLGSRRDELLDRHTRPARRFRLQPKLRRA